ncbi:MAG: transglutaminase-like domain-containing protein [Clostridia bacterium]
MFEEYSNLIDRQFNAYLSAFPYRTQEILSYFANLNAESKILFKKAITQLTIADLLDINFTDLAAHVNSILLAYNTFDYAKTIPCDIFFDFVLPLRINNENFVLFSPTFFDLLKDKATSNNIVKTIVDANLFCASLAEYASTDSRTASAKAVIVRGVGRCGEETVLLVSVLRSLCVPSRQVYCPYWSHCDDNHAWVEVYANGKWSFLGACEPAEQLDYGWFASTATRALLATYPKFRFNKLIKDTYSLQYNTQKYAKVRKITVKVNFPKAQDDKDDNVQSSLNSSVADLISQKIDVKINMCLVNYCQIKILLTKKVNPNSQAIFYVGEGDVFFLAKVGSVVSLSKKVDENNYIIDFETPLTTLPFELVPAPYGLISQQNLSKNYLAQFDKATKTLRTSHKKAKQSKFSFYYDLAVGNANTIQQFVELPQFSNTQKFLLLSSLRDKDFCDITLETLIDTASVFKFSSKQPSDLFIKYVLPPYADYEMIYPVRMILQEKFKNSSPQEIYNLLRSYLDCGYVNPKICPSVVNALKYKLVTKYALPIYFVQICRAINIPARLSPLDASIEYFNQKEFVSIDLAESKTSQIKIINEDKLELSNYFTISKFVDGNFTNINLPIDSLVASPLNAINKVDDTSAINITDKENSSTFGVSNGTYLACYAFRQIDDSLSGVISVKTCVNSQIDFAVKPICDKTAELIKSVALPNYFANFRRNCIYAYVDNTEPSKHLLAELILNIEILIKEDIFVKIYANTSNSLITKLKEFNNFTVVSHFEQQEFTNIRRLTNIGEDRLPLVFCSKNNLCRYAHANYNVGLVDLLIKVLKV